MNLGTNAAHAMPSGGVLQVELGPAKPDAGLRLRHPALAQGRWMRLRIADSGVGMEPDVLERAFEPFFSTRPPGEGSGLGLSMVHGIIEGHGGVVEVESVPGAGTRFDILLPTTDEPPASRARETGGSTGGERGCVLLVDDEPAVVTIAQDLLESEGYRVAAFTNPQQAVEGFAANPDAYCVVVTDYTMPNMTGLQLARSVKQLRPDVPVILTTGFAESDVLGPDAQPRLAEVLAKPYGGADLTAAIARAVARAPDAQPGS
jgi:CheY-like chemotaxis protein